MRIYLVGPITGQSVAGVLDWRALLKTTLPRSEFLDPAAAPFDSSLVTETSALSTSETLRRLEHGRFVLDRNKHMLRSADVVFANFIGNGERASIGSIGELFWANAFGKPIILVREQTGNVHDHAMLNAVASKVCNSIEDGCDALRELARTAA